ncbi:DNA ligase 1-like [Diachasma alloeum]|uniref:DNA ligase 1-like n=1 Tax=Diachasma alloeum TaxID=454923 RepID=UPI000738109F|nr:DNA ligase 1-like [Diachasma alloeum]
MSEKLKNMVGEEWTEDREVREREGNNVEAIETGEQEQEGGLGRATEGRGGKEVASRGKDMGQKIERIREVMEKKNEEIAIIGGDFNAIIGTKEGLIEEDELEDKESRKSKDKRKVDKDGKMLDESGWSILNGNCKEDEEGQFTRERGLSRSVIDHAITDDTGRDLVDRFEVGEECDSDDFPLVVTLKEEVEGRVREKGKKNGKRSVKVSFGGKDKKEKLREELESVDWKERSLAETLAEVKVRVKEIKERIDKETKKKKKLWGDWWDEECKRKQERGKKDEYRVKKREFNRMCGMKKEEEQAKFEEEVERALEGGRVWEVINRERKERKKINEGLGLERYKDHFMRLLGGVDGRVIVEGRREETEEEGAGLSQKEVKDAIFKLKSGKAAGEDEIENEIWKEGGLD